MVRHTTTHKASNGHTKARSTVYGFFRASIGCDRYFFMVALSARWRVAFITDEKVDIVRPINVMRELIAASACIAKLPNRIPTLGQTNRVASTSKLFFVWPLSKFDGELNNF